MPSPSFDDRCMYTVHCILYTVHCTVLLYCEDVWVNRRRGELIYPDHPTLVQLEQFCFAAFGLLFDLGLSAGSKKEGVRGG